MNTLVVNTKNKHASIILLFLFFFQSTFAQTAHWIVKPIVPAKRFFYDEKKQSSFVIFEKNNKKGVVTTNGKVIIEPIYDNYLYADDSNLFFSAGSEGKNDLINRDGKVIGSAFSQKNILSPDYVLFNQNNLWGILNKDGNVVEKAVYDSFDEENKTELEYDLVLKNDKISKKIHITKAKMLFYSLPDTLKKITTITVPQKYSIIRKEQKVALFSLKTQQTISPFFNEIQEIGNGLYSVKDTLYGIYDADNQRFIVPIKHIDKIRIVGDYFAGYYYDKKVRKNYAAAFDRKGNKIIDYDEVYIRMFTNGTFLVGKNEKFAQINVVKDTLRKFTENKDLLEFSFSNWLKIRKNDKNYFFNACDSIGKETYYDSADFYSNPDYVVVSKNKKYGVVSAENKPILPLDFDSPVTVCEKLKDERNAKVQLFIVKNAKKYGLFAKNQLLPIVFDTIYQYDGNFVVSLKGKSGMIGFDSMFQKKTEKNIFPNGFETNFTQILSVFKQKKQDSIAILKVECDTISSKLFQSIKKLGYEPFMICGPNDTWCKAGMSKYFKITPKPFSAALARNPLQVQLENQHLQLYNADLKYTQAIDYVFFMGKIKEYPILSEMILERCYQYLLDQNKGKYKEKNAQKLINQFLQQY